jgi:hypothetical protein
MLHAPPISLSIFITRSVFGEEYRSLSSSLCSYFHSLVASSVLVPNKLLSTLFPNTHGPRRSLSVYVDPLNAELKPICHLLVLLGAHHILHVSRIRVNSTN